MDDDKRYSSLDLVRGVCACLVLIMHSNFLTGYEVLPSAYLSVDMFFLMSGFVIGLVYDKRLQDKGFAAPFIVKRLCRLAPMWWVGVCLGLIATVVTYRSLGATARAVFDFFPTLFFIPTVYSDELFPLNPPGWSLLYEMVANISYALIIARFSNTKLFAIIGIMACLLLALGFQHGSLDGGAVWPGFALSLVRVFFSFTIGLVTFRLHRRTDEGSKVLPILLLGFITFLFAVPVTPNIRPYFDCIFVIVALPSLMALLMVCNQKCSLLSDALGRLSYPLYTIHAPIYILSRAIWGHIYLKNPHLPIGLAFAVAIACVFLALFLGVKVDPWFQDLVRYRFSGTRSQMRVK